MPDLNSPRQTDRCNCTALRKASRRLSQFYDAALAPCGLKSTQYAILSAIARHAETPLTMTALADALAMDRSTFGQNLRPLQRDGLLAFAAASTDRRSRHVTLTPEGHASLAAAQPLWQQAQSLFESRFGVEAAADLRSLLRVVAEDRGLANGDGGAAQQWEQPA